MKFEYLFGNDWYLLDIRDDEKLAKAMDSIWRDKYGYSFEQREHLLSGLGDIAWLRCLENHRADLKEYFLNEAEMEYEYMQRKMEEERNVGFGE